MESTYTLYCTRRAPEEGHTESCLSALALSCRSVGMYARNELGNRNRRYGDVGTFRSLAQGGALRCTSSCKLELTRSRLLHNTARVGGSVFVNGQSTMSVSRCEFIRNEALETGGAIYVHESTANLTATTFVGNIASSGGAIYAASPLAVRLHSLQFSESAGILKGSDIAMYQPREYYVMNTSFTGALFYTDVPTHDCSENNCSVGEHCSFQRGSLQLCKRCDDALISAKGQACSACPSGNRSNKAQSACVKCAAGRGGTDGSCCARTLDAREGLGLCV